MGCNMKSKALLRKVKRRENDKSFGLKSVIHVVMRKLMLTTSCLRFALVNLMNEVDVPRYLIGRDPIEYAKSMDNEVLCVVRLRNE